MIDERCLLRVILKVISIKLHLPCQRLHYAFHALSASVASLTHLVTRNLYSS